MSGAHAPISPSSLAELIQCHGRRKLVASVSEPPPTEESIEGDAAHIVAAAALRGEALPVAVDVSGTTVQVDADMIEGAMLWAETVGKGATVETRVEIKRLHPSDCWGTPDAWRYDPATRTLYVWDYKYGYEFVDEFENWQLMAYAIGIIDTIGLNDQLVTVVLTIVQPRCYDRRGAVRPWVTSGSGLRPYANIAINAIEESYGERPQTKVGPQCLFCPAAHVCETLQRGASKLYAFAGHSERAVLTPIAVATEAVLVDEALKVLNARKTALRAQLDSLLRGGAKLPYWSLEPKQGRLAWDVPAETVFLIGDAMGKDLRKPVEPITPTQAIKVKKIDEAVISAYSSRPSAGLELVRDDGTQARRIFGGSTQ